MKKTIVKVLSMVLVLSMVFALTACSNSVLIRFVDKNGNDLPWVSGGSSDTTGETPATDAPATEAPATEAPATDAPATDAATTGAPVGDPTTQPAATQPAATQPAATQAAPAGDPTTKEEIVAKYVVVYNTTKAAGFTGKDSMSVSSVALEGKENSVIKGIVDKAMASDPSTVSLPPSTDSNPGNTCMTTAADIKTAEYKDNGDGTATIKLVPISTTGSKRFADAQGKMFNVMEDPSATLEGIPTFSWATGDAKSNVTLLTEDGYCEVTFDKNTNMMTKATYVLITKASINHANVAVFKDKSASATFTYTCTFPG